MENIFLGFGLSKSKESSIVIKVRKSKFDILTIMICIVKRKSIKIYYRLVVSI